MTTQVPTFEKNRWWSNPGLNDPEVMIASILGDPTTLDLIQAMLEWGIDRVDSVRRSTRSERSEAEDLILDTIYEPVRQGVADARRVTS